MADEVVGLGAGERAQFGGNEAEARQRIRDAERIERIKRGIVDLVDEYWMAWKAPIKCSDLSVRWTVGCHYAGSTTTEVFGELVLERRVHRLLNRRGIGYFVPYAIWHAMDGQEQVSLFAALPRGKYIGRRPKHMLG